MIFKLMDINSLDIETTKKYYPMLTDMRKKKINDMSNAHERSVAFCGEIIARQCLSRLLDAPEFSFQLLCNTDLKSVVGNYSAGISIAALGDIVACAVNEGAVGISLAQVKPFSFSEAQSLCSDSELRSVYSGSREQFSELINKNICDEKNVMEMFALYSSLKDALFRASGRGFRSSAVRTEFIYNGAKISCSDKSFTVSHYEIDRDKNIAVAIVERCL